jgi:uncharacterized membrane protein
MSESDETKKEKRGVPDLTVGRLDLILDLAYRTYGSILDNSRSLDVKGSILLALVCIVVFHSIDAFTDSSCWSTTLLSISITFGIASIVLVLFALRIQKFYALPYISQAKKYYSERQPAKKMGAQFFSNLELAINENSRMVDAKANILLVAYIYAGASFGISFLSFLIEVFTGG